MADLATKSLLHDKLRFLVTVSGVAFAHTFPETAVQRGVVVARHAERGETLEAGKKVVTVADLSRTRIEAEIDEFDSVRLKLGQRVEIRIDRP